MAKSTRPASFTAVFAAVFAPNMNVVYNSGGTDYDVDYVAAGETSVGDTYAAVTSRSYHKGGVDAVFMDGSVHFIRNAISLATWRALSTRAGAEMVASDGY